jgi:hypothetical protein
MNRGKPGINAKTRWQKMGNLTASRAKIRRGDKSRFPFTAREARISWILTRPIIYSFQLVK